MTDLFGTEHELTGAIISDCGLYRYHLWRTWDLDKAILCFVMQNPSTADATEDDATIRRCIGFAKRDGFGGISVRNVFALRATDERELLTHPNPVGPENGRHLMAARNVSVMTRLVAAWGVPFGPKRGRLADAYRDARNAMAIQDAYCLGKTKDGHPRHPLFVRADAPLIPLRNV